MIILEEDFVEVLDQDQLAWAGKSEIYLTKFGNSRPGQRPERCQHDWQEAHKQLHEFLANMRNRSFTLTVVEASLAFTD